MTEKPTYEELEQKVKKLEEGALRAPLPVVAKNSFYPSPFWTAALYPEL